jgi:hypothetical protein
VDDAIKRQLGQRFPDIAHRYGCCERKLAYATLAQALAIKDRREGRVPGLTLQIYACAYGEHYHLSSQPPTAAQLHAQKLAFQSLEAEQQACAQQEVLLCRQAEALVRAIQRRSREVPRMLPSPS